MDTMFQLSSKCSPNVAQPEYQFVIHGWGQENNAAWEGVWIHVLCFLLLFYCLLTQVLLGGDRWCLSISCVERSSSDLPMRRTSEEKVTPSSLFHFCGLHATFSLGEWERLDEKHAPCFRWKSTAVPSVLFGDWGKKPKNNVLWQLCQQE